MNLHQIVRGAITSVNPDVAVVLRRSNGYTTNENYQQVPSYEDLAITVQPQALSYKDLTQIDGLNINGTRRAVYLNGAAMATVRNLQVGGDLFVFPAGTLPEGDTWLVAYVLEQWPDWAKCVITLQNDG